MKNKVLYWAPRVLSILFVGFLCLFSFDSFVKFNGWETILAVLAHWLIPAIILLGTIIAWKRDLFGALLFFFFAIYYVFMVGFNRHWSWYASISGPAVIIAILYLFSWFQDRKSK